MVAALLDGSADDAEDIIDALVDARLLEVSRPDPLGGYRYRCHDLVRIFAREQALAVESPPDRRSVVARVLERLLTLALRADEALHSRRVRLPEAAVSGDAPPDPLAWFEAERHTLTAAVRRAVSLGLAETAWLWSLGRTACQMGDVGREIEHLQEALTLFRRLDVPVWEAKTRRQLGAASRPGRPQP